MRVGGAVCGTKCSPDLHLQTNSCPVGAPRIERVRANREPVTAVETHSARPWISARFRAGSEPVLPPTDLELPTGQRTPAYRFFEALPATISFTAVGLVFILPFVDGEHIDRSEHRIDEREDEHEAHRCEADRRRQSFEESVGGSPLPGRKLEVGGWKSWIGAGLETRRDPWTCRVCFDGGEWFAVRSHSLDPGCPGWTAVCRKMQVR